MFYTVEAAQQQNEQLKKAQAHTVLMQRINKKKTKTQFNPL